MIFLRLKVNFSSLQLTDICKKVTSHAKTSAKLIFVVAKLFKARKTPRTVPFPDTKNHIYQQRWEKMQKVPNKRFRNSLNDKFWLGTFFTINHFLQLLAINPSLQAFFVYLACLLACKMIALQESSYRKENRLQLLLARKKRLLTMSVCEEFLVPLSLLILFVSCQFDLSLSFRRPRLLIVCCYYLYFYFGPLPY